MLYVNVPRSTKISASRNNLKREPSKDSTQSIVQHVDCLPEAQTECAQEYYQDARGGTLCEEHGRAQDQASLQTVQKKIIQS